MPWGWSGVQWCPWGWICRSTSKPLCSAPQLPFMLRECVSELQGRDAVAVSMQSRVAGPQGCSYGFLKPRTSPRDAASAKAVMRKDQRMTRQGGSAAPGHLRSPPRAPGAGQALHRSAAADSCLSHPLLRSLPGHPFPAGHCQPDSRDCSMAAASRSASRPPARRGIAAAVPADSRCSGSGFHSFPFFHASGSASAPWGCAEEEPKSFSLSSPVTTSSPRPPSALCAQGGVAAH